MKKSTGCLLSLCWFLLGTLLGFFLAPIRKGIQVVSLNTNGDSNLITGPFTDQKKEHRPDSKLK